MTKHRRKAVYRSRVRLVPRAYACPSCGERHPDMLLLDPRDTSKVECASCGTKFSVKE